uniref:C-type lectin domain-containing protein n=1 Tax=Panagrellus redivivus TaxID=6233 RepID=A0A7E4VE21_PANRE
MDSSHTNMSQFDIILSSLNCACKSQYIQLVIDNIPYSECFQYYQSLASPDNIFCGNGGIIATTYTKKRLDFITDTIIARTVEAPPKRITVGLNRASAMSPWGWQNYDSTALNYTGYPTFADVVQPDATWGYLENYSGLNWRLGSDNGDISYNYLCATRASDAYLDS